MCETQTPPFPPPPEKRSKRSSGAPRNGKIRAPCIRKRAGFGKMCAPCIRKAPQIAVGGYTARISCQEGALFAARAPRIMHGARILPRIDAQERTAREYCHRRMPKSASRVHFAIVERPGTHQGIILPWPAARKCTAATSCHGSLLQECFSTTYCQEGPRLPGLAAKSQWCHEVGRPRPNVTSANSTTRANTSKKP